MDVIGAFLADECEVGTDHKAPFKAVYERYAEWCAEGGERPETGRKFNARLKERGRFEARRSGPGGSNEWHGLRLLKKQTPDFAGKLKQDSEISYNDSENISSRDKGTNSFSASVASVGGPTDDQERRIRELVRKGFSEDSARQEVLASDHPVGCGCEVCL
jgi:phage/plasmid-associated DNA primase